MEGYICQNCGEDWAEADLQIIDDVHERVMPGDTMPDGECPDCGAVCFAKETPEEQAAERVRNAAPDLLAALEAHVTYEESVTATISAISGEKFTDAPWLAAARAAIARARGRSA